MKTLVLLLAFTVAGLSQSVTGIPSSNNASVGATGATGATGPGISGLTVGAMVTGSTATTVQTNPVLYPVAKIPQALYAFGDSYPAGAGTVNPVSQGYASILARAIPSTAQYYNQAVSGSNSDTIAFNALSFFSGSPTQPTITLGNGGANDGGNCGTSSACINNYQQELSAWWAWVTIPADARQMASVAAKSGVWSADNSFPSVNPGVTSPAPIGVSSPGTPQSTTSNGATLTFSIPSSASPFVGVTTQVTTAQTGTFTVSVDGSLVTDSCSSTTTFSSGPCRALLTQTTTPFRQQFTVTPNQTHTVIITTTNGSKVAILGVDWAPAAGDLGTNALFVNSTYSGFSNAALYNTAASAVAATLSPYVPLFYVDINAGTYALTSADVATGSTATCSASSTANHPNSCGELKIAQSIYAAEVAGSYVFTAPPLSGQNIMTTPGAARVIKVIDTAFAQAAASGAALFTTPVSGTYRISYFATKSTAATTSSILGGTTGFSFVYLDGTDFVTRTITLPEFSETGANVAIGTGNALNTTAAILHGSSDTFKANNGDAITYSFGWISVGVTPMQYSLHIVVESMSQ